MNQKRAEIRCLDICTARFHAGLQASCDIPLSISFDKIKSLEYDVFMSSLLEIEEAADVLPIEEKKELVAFLLARLRVAGDELPPVRDIPKSTIDKWGADDEEGYKKFLAGA